MKIRFFLITLIVSLGAHTNGNIEDHLYLTSADFELEKISNKAGAPISRWDADGKLFPSYNKWRCFSTVAATVTCSIHEMEELTKTPMIAVYSGNETLEIETSPGDDIDCVSTTEQWDELLEGEDFVCTLAAFLQDLPHENYGGTNRRTLWIIEAFKTSKGYWVNPRLLEKLN